MGEWRWALSIGATVHTAHLVELHDPDARILSSSVKSLCGLRPLMGWRVDDSVRTRCRRCELRGKMNAIIRMREEGQGDD